MTARLGARNIIDDVLFWQNRIILTTYQIQLRDRIYPDDN